MKYVSYVKLCENRKYVHKLSQNTNTEWLQIVQREEYYHEAKPGLFHFMRQRQFKATQYLFHITGTQIQCEC